MSISRRDFIGCFGVALVAAPCRVMGASGSSEPYFDPQFVKRWLDQADDGLSAASGALLLGRFADPTYFLLQSIAWRPSNGEALPSVEVPKGFVTDLASVPRLFWSAFPRDGRYAFAAIVHDYLYWEQPVTRRVADEIFKSIMIEFKVSSVDVGAIHTAVRVGGRGAWNTNKELRASGEKRILREHPTSPSTTWQTWKTRDVF